MTSDQRVTVAVVEDEPDLREAVGSYLGLHGFDVLAYESAEAFRADPLAARARIAILDVAMPGENGLSLARSISRQRHAGIIMATANGANMARAIGLESGADDYLVKPYELRELLARIRALLRRLPEPQQRRRRPPSAHWPSAASPSISPPAPQRAMACHWR